MNGAIAIILKSYTEQDIWDCAEWLAKQDYWRDKGIDFTIIRSQIAKFKQLPKLIGSVKVQMTAKERDEMYARDNANLPDPLERFKQSQAKMRAERDEERRLKAERDAKWNKLNK